MRFSSMVFEWLTHGYGRKRCLTEDVTPVVANPNECPNFETILLRPITIPEKQELIFIGKFLQTFLKSIFQ